MNNDSINNENPNIQNQEISEISSNEPDIEKQPKKNKKKTSFFSYFSLYI